MPRLVIYTVITGAYEPLISPYVVDSKADYVCLIDIPVPEVPPWEQRIIRREIKDARRESRRLKILSHQHFPDAEYILYHDPNVWFKTTNIPSWLGRHDMALCTHPERDCVYDEAKACIEADKGDPDTIRAQVARYKAEAYPEHAGLAATTIILRKQTEAVRQFNEAWWQEVSNGSVRDQVSFNYTCWKLGMGYDLIPGHLYSNTAFEYATAWHVPPEEGTWM